MKIRPPAQTDSKCSRAATPVAFICAMVEAHRRYGSDPSDALALAGIDPGLLEDASNRVTAEQMEVMSGASMQALDDEALGWFSHPLPWGSYGLLCRASITSPNLEVALKRWCRHHRLLTRDILLSLRQRNGVATIEIEVCRPLGVMHEFCQVTILRMILGYACWVIDSRIPLLKACFPFPPPAHREVYPLLFTRSLVFDAERASVSFDARYLALPLRRDENALRKMLQRALPLTVLQYRRDRLLVERVRQLFRSQAVMTAALCADRVAERLHVSTRTLHRQLHEEGASLQQLKVEARQERAIEMLNRSDCSIKQVAHAVGFRNEKSFSRAFRQWTGVAPSEYCTRPPTEAVR